MDENLRSPLRRFVVSNLSFQRKNGYIFSAWGKLRLIEHHIVLELDRPVFTRPSDLALRLNQPAAQIAHVLRSLKQRGIVREVPGDSAREKFVLLTLKGRSISRGLDDISNQLMNQLSQNISTDEQRGFYDFWEILNNGLGAPRTVARPGDHPLRLQSRRFTRIFGYFNRRPEASLLSYPELHVLHALDTLDAKLTLDSLAELLRVPRATLKKIVTKLHADGLCSRATDRAGVALSLLPKGATSLRLAIEGLVQMLCAQLAPSVAQRASELVPFFELAVQRWEPHYEIMRKDPALPTLPNFFVELQVRALCEYARSYLGILQESLTDKELIDSRLVVVFDGPTPCFCVRLKYGAARQSEQRSIHLVEFGFSNRIEWDAISELLHSILLGADAYLSGSAEVVVEELERCRLAHKGSGRPIGPLPLIEFGAAATPLQRLLSSEQSPILR